MRQAGHADQTAARERLPPTGEVGRRILRIVVAGQEEHRHGRRPGPLCPGGPGMARHRRAGRAEETRASHGGVRQVAPAARAIGRGDVEAGPALVADRDPEHGQARARVELRRPRARRTPAPAARPSPPAASCTSRGTRAASSGERSSTATVVARSSALRGFRASTRVRSPRVSGNARAQGGCATAAGDQGLERALGVAARELVHRRCSPVTLRRASRCAPSAGTAAGRPARAWRRTSRRRGRCGRSRAPAGRARDRPPPPAVLNRRVPPPSRAKQRRRYDATASASVARTCSCGQATRCEAPVPRWSTSTTSRNSLTFPKISLTETAASVAAPPGPPSR